jgi:hypothetical protein
LQKLGAPAAEVLMRMDTSRMSEEQKTRLSTLCAEFEPLTAEQVRDFGSDVQFLLDCLYADDSAVRAAAAGRLEKVTGRPLDIDVNAATQTRYAAIDRLRGLLVPPPTTKPGGKG